MAVDREGIPLSGMLLLVVLCLLWGANMVSIKVSIQGVPPVMSAAIRSAFAALILWAYARTKSERVFLDARHWIHGLVLGGLFGTEFLVLYWGPRFTDVSHAVIFLYSQPLWTALLAHFLLPDDRLQPSKSAGMVLSFVGLVLVFGSRSNDLGPLYWVGDLMEVVAGFLWAATTVYIKKFISSREVSHFQTLFSQLFFSIPVLVAGVLLFEWNQPVVLSPVVVGALFYQTAVVAAFSYLFWFWMIHRYQVSQLASFTFLTPLFGVILSGVLLHEPLPLMLWAGLGLVAGGIYLVNRPARAYSGCPK